MKTVAPGELVQAPTEVKNRVLAGQRVRVTVNRVPSWVATPDPDAVEPGARVAIEEEMADLLKNSARQKEVVGADVGLPIVLGKAASVT